jgi:Glycosyltransferase family 87
MNRRKEESFFFILHLRVLVTLYAVLALGWVVFARWVVHPLLISSQPGRAISGLKRYIQDPPALFLSQDILARWRDFSGAVLIALFLHLTIVLILRQYDLRAAAGRSSTEVRAGRCASLVLLILSLVFLAVTVVSGPRHDYYFYLQIWYEVLQGHNPWFLVPPMSGMPVLNAYGPLFNLFAGLSWLNPITPKLLFAYGYVLFSLVRVKTLTASRPMSCLAMIVLTALFWNPFPWVEIAMRGHFDILVGLSCVWAIRAWVRGHDRLSGIWLALGVLLKFMPVVLLPFLALDRGRFRARFIIAATAAIAIGMALSCYVWGLATLRPLEFLATRRSTGLSIFWFIRGRYSPLRWFGAAANYDDLAPILLVLALLRAWFWYRRRQPHVDAAVLVAILTTVLLHRTGYPQYHMVPFVLGSSWVVRQWAEIRARPARVVAIACYFGWLAAFDLYYVFADDQMNTYYWPSARDAVGLPTFLFGCAFLVAVVRSSIDEAAARPGAESERPS